MEGVVYLTKAELCEAVKAYLMCRGMLPAHGVVKNVVRANKSDEAGMVDFVVGQDNAKGGV